MKHRFFSFFLLIAGCYLAGCESTTPKFVPDNSLNSGNPFETKNVVMIVIDGPRFKETWGDPTKQNIPHFASELAVEGINHDRFYNRGATHTISGHAALTTGNYQWMANDGSVIPRFPSIFQSWLAKSKVNPEQAQIITSKKKLEVLSDCVDLEWRGKFNPIINAKDRDDAETLLMSLSVFEKHHPRMTLIHFRGPDVYGHSNDWDNYLKSIADTDQFTFEIWTYLQNDPFYKGVTTLIVTNDHGRHTDGNRDGFVSHGDFCEGCMHINFYAAGPDFHKNMIATKPRQLVDVAPTIAQLMGVELAGATGSVMWELFK